jgi:ATP-dependent helicase HrpB
MLELPVHPRLARVLVAGEELGIPDTAALAVALLGERDIRSAARTHLGARGIEADGRGPSDIEELAERFLEAEDLPVHRVRALGLDPRTVDAVARSHRHIRRALRDPGGTPRTSDESPETRLAICLLRGYPDRVARRRETGSPDLVLAGGETARLSPWSVVHDARYLLALDAEIRAGATRAGATIVRLATRIDPDWLLELYTDSLREEDELAWNSHTERVDRIRRLSYGSIVLDESRTTAAPSPAAGRVLARAARNAAWEHAALERLAARLQLVGDCFPELGVPQLTTDVGTRLLETACQDATSFAELRVVPLTDRLLAQLSPGQARGLRELAPDTIALPGGRRLSIEYPARQPPWVASRLQDFFGLAEGPRIAAERVPLTLHLLAPNRRAVQVTSDLAGFWQRHYPHLRRELMRRYPKHDWPEDGATAKPPPPGRLRSPR